MNLAQLQAALRPLLRRIHGLAGRGAVRRVDDGKGHAQVQLRILAGEVRDGVDVVQPYGFSSRPLPGAEAVAIFVGGNRDQGVAATVGDRRHRPQDLEPGEVAVHDNRGLLLKLRTDGSILIRASSKLVVDAPLLEVTGSITAGGDVSDGSGGPSASLAGMRQVFNPHVHPDPQGGSTGPTPTPMI